MNGLPPCCVYARVRACLCVSVCLCLCLSVSLGWNHRRQSKRGAKAKRQKATEPRRIHVRTRRAGGRPIESSRSEDAARRSAAKHPLDSRLIRSFFYRSSNEGAWQSQLGTYGAGWIHRDTSEAHASSIRVVWDYARNFKGSLQSYILGIFSRRTWLVTVFIVASLFSNELERA